jgi:hypothetical protein
MGVSASVCTDSAEHGARVVADQRGFGPFTFGWIVVRERSPAGDWGRRHRHLIRGHVEAMSEVSPDQFIIAFFDGRRQKAPRVGPLVPLTVADLDQFAEAQDFRDAQLGRLELEPLDVHDHIENRVRELGAGAIGPALSLVPAPARIAIGVRRIGAGDVRSALSPRHTQSVERLRLTALDRFADGPRGNVSIGVDRGGCLRLAALMNWMRLASHVADPDPPFG